MESVQSSINHLEEARKCEPKGDSGGRDKHLLDHLEELEKSISARSREGQDTLSLRMVRATMYFALGCVEDGIDDVSRIVDEDLIRALEEIGKKSNSEDKLSLEKELFYNFLLICGRRYGEAVLNLRAYEQREGRPAETHGQIVYAATLGHAHAMLGFNSSINERQLALALEEYKTALNLTLDSEAHPDLKGYVTSRVANPEKLSGRTDLQALVERVDPFAVATSIRGYSLISDKLGREKEAGSVSLDNLGLLDLVVTAKMDKRDFDAAGRFYDLITGKVISQ